MKITIRTIGRLKQGPEKVLVEHYRQRLTWPVTIQEYCCPQNLPAPELKRREGELLLSQLLWPNVMVALDQQGQLWSSEELASWLTTLKNQATPSLTFVIGGASGLSEAVLQQASQRLALGRVTWPHLLVRGLLLEQLYRCQQILAYHPYHR